MQGKKLYLIIAAVVVVLGVGGFYMLSQKKAQQTPTQGDQTMQVLTLSPDSLGLQTAFRSDNKAMKFTLNNAADVKAVEYQISYTKQVKGDQVPEGLIGTMDITPGNTAQGIGYREFGTCSSGICRYDTLVSDITLTLKVTKTDGKVYQVTQTISRPQ